MVMYGFSTLPQIMGIILVVLGIIGFVGFLMYELKVESPVLNVRLFKNRTFAFSNLAALINYSATFAVTFLLSLYLQYIKALDPQSAGLILVAQPVMMAIFAPIAGRLSDRFQPQKLAALGMALSTIRPVYILVYNSRNQYSLYNCRPACDRAGFWSFLLPQHQCNHGICGEEVLWCCICNGQYNASFRSDIQHGTCTYGFCHIYWKRTDNFCSVPFTFKQYSHSVPNKCSYVLYRDIRSPNTAKS